MVCGVGVFDCFKKILFREETKIYNRFAEISKDKTAIIVTHRLGSVKLADRIYVGPCFICPENNRGSKLRPG